MFDKMLSKFLAKALIYPSRRPIVKTPSDYAMPYQDVDFQSKDGIPLKAWYIPGTSEHLIIMTHPMPFSRYGFHTQGQGLMKVSDVEVELLKTVKHLNAAGYGVFTLDFRNHGESGTANGGACGVGYHEWQDVVGAMAYIKATPELQTKTVAFVSHCMGANATLIAVGKEPALFADVKAIVAIQPVSMAVFVPHYLSDKIPPLRNAAPYINEQIKALAGFGLEDMTPAPYIPDIQIPVFYVQVRNDAWTEPADVQSFYDSTTSPKDILWIEGELERFDGYNYFGEDPEAMLNFLRQYLH